HISDLDHRIADRSFAGAKPRKRHDYKGIKRKNGNHQAEIFGTYGGSFSQGIEKHKTCQGKNAGGYEYRDGGSGHHLLFVFIAVEEPEKGGFHSVGQENVEKDHPG